MEGLILQGKFVASSSYDRTTNSGITKKIFIATILVDDRFTYTVSASEDIFSAFSLGDSISIPVYATAYNNKLYLNARK